MVFSYNCLYPASHAHTLLLDLEQLVVVANLDKIKLDSSTCSSTIPATSKSTTNNNSMSSMLNNHYIHNCNDDGVGYQYNGDFYGNSLPYSCETNIKTLEKNTNHFGLFDQFLDISKLMLNSWCCYLKLSLTFCKFSVGFFFVMFNR